MVSASDGKKTSSPIIIASAAQARLQLRAAGDAQVDARGLDARYELANITPLRTRSPTLGRSAFAHKGGASRSGIRRNNSRTYEHIDPALIGR